MDLGWLLLKVSVVIPAYNQSSYLRQALLSVLAQTHQDFDIIVVDDGSTDDTRAVCERLADPRLQYVYQKNDGTKGCGARNVGMVLATGEWIALLDQDDVWHPDKLTQQLKRVACSPGVGAVFSRVRFIDADGVVLRQQSEPLPEGEVFHQLIQHNHYYVSTGIFRRDLLGRIGLPDESTGFADWALWAGVARHAPVAVVDEFLVDYREHSQSFLGQLSGPAEVRKLVAHATTLNRNALRRHPGCLECRRAVTAGQVQTARWFLRIARRSLAAGRVESVAESWWEAWHTAPLWLLRPWVLLSQVVRLVLSGLMGFIGRSWRFLVS